MFLGQREFQNRVGLAVQELFEVLEGGDFCQLEDALGDKFEVKVGINRDHARSNGKATAGALQGLCRDIGGWGLGS